MARKPQFKKRGSFKTNENDEVEPGEINPIAAPSNFKFGFDPSVKFNWR